MAVTRCVAALEGATGLVDVGWQQMGDHVRMKANAASTSLQHCLAKHGKVIYHELGLVVLARVCRALSARRAALICEMGTCSVSDREPTPEGGLRHIGGAGDMCSSQQQHCDEVHTRCGQPRFRQVASRSGGMRTKGPVLEHGQIRTSLNIVRSWLASALSAAMTCLAQCGVCRGVRFSQAIKPCRACRGHMLRPIPLALPMLGVYSMDLCHTSARLVRPMLRCAPRTSASEQVDWIAPCDRCACT